MEKEVEDYKERLNAIEEAISEMVGEEDLYSLKKSHLYTLILQFLGLCFYLLL